MDRAHQQPEQRLRRCSNNSAQTKRQRFPPGRKNKPPPPKGGRAPKPFRLFLRIQVFGSAEILPTKTHKNPIQTLNACHPERSEGSQKPTSSRSHSVAR